MGWHKGGDVVVVPQHDSHKPASRKKKVAWATYQWRNMEELGLEKIDLIPLTGIIYRHKMLVLGKKSYLVLL